MSTETNTRDLPEVDVMVNPGSDIQTVICPECADDMDRRVKTGISVLPVALSVHIAAEATDGMRFHIECVRHCRLVLNLPVEGTRTDGRSSCCLDSAEVHETDPTHSVFWVKRGN